MNGTAAAHCTGPGAQEEGAPVTSQLGWHEPPEKLRSKARGTDVQLIPVSAALDAVTR